MKTVGILSARQPVWSRLGWRIGRKKLPVGFKVAVVHQERVVSRWVLVKAFGKEYGRAQVHRSAPKGGEQFALDAQMLDVLRVFGRLDRGDLFGELDAHATGLLRVEMHAKGFVEEVAGLAIPFLAFPFVGRKLDVVAIGAVERFIDVEHGLNVVVAGGKLVEADKWITKRGGIDDGRGAWLPALNVESEKLRAEGFLLAKLETRLARRVGGNAKQNVPVERLAAD